MSNRFNKSLNLQSRLFGFPVAGYIFAGVGVVLLTTIFGVVVAFVGGIAFFGFGVIIGNKWHSGELQKWCYWHLPFAKYFICRKIPSSHHRRFH
ncbi:MAG: hypothetical protein GY694_00425 [Gammaproteobacteria bacterium]|nr:hypothetical protein [Gammaproteobacteria bacterium]